MVIPPRSIRPPLDKARHPRILFLHPWNPFASLLVGLPPLLSFVPIVFPSFFPQQPQGYTVMISLSCLSTFETTHVDNLDNRIIPLTNSLWLNHVPLEVS